MALKEIYHTVASVLPIDADAGTIPAGLLVTLDANFLVSLPNAAADMCVGVAGDTKRQAPGQNNPESANVVMGSYQTTTSGATRWTQNRVADNYNEVLASSEMTVYHGAGEFWTDQYASESTTGGALTWTGAAPLYNTFGTNANVTAGSWTTENTGSYISGCLLGEPQALPSGVPGTDVQGSISYGNYIHLRLWH